MAELSIKTEHASHHLPRQTTSRLLRLPSELRHIVYAYTLGGNTWSINVSGGQTKPRVDNASKHALAILRVNRQIYFEARFFPYLYNTFEGRHSGHLREWIQSLSAEYRESVTCVKHCQRSYLIQGPHGVDVSPIFWMDTPRMMHWKLKGLKRIEIEVALHKWGLHVDEAKCEAVKVLVLAKLRTLVEYDYPGVTIDVSLRRGF